ncbi:MAG: hypothetical protein JWN41_369 [Thermoleophilia bacterium]|nr:hypothetical protein [Thermoleophilia bacterium]
MVAAQEPGDFVSYYDGIANVVTGLSASPRALSSVTSANTGPQSGDAKRVPAATNPLSTKLDSIFRSTVQRDLQTFFTRGAAGEFDDPALSLAEQAAATRLELLRREAAAGRPVNTASPDSVARDLPSTPEGAAPVSGGGPTSEAATTGAERELSSVRLAQSEARLQIISKKLRAEYPAAATIDSASIRDPKTFQPRTRAEVKAFAQRMVIDAAEGAARLEIVKNQLDIARADARVQPSPETAAKVAELAATFKRQKVYVQQLAAIVDDTSQGGVTDAGVDAMAGHTARSSTDLSARELAGELRANGATEDEIAQVVGAQELSVEEAVTPGGSTRLRQLADTMLTTLLLKFDNIRHEERARIAKKEAEQRHVERKHEKKVEAQKSAESQAVQRATEQRAIAQQLNAQAAAQRESVQQQAINAYGQRRSA